MRSSLATKEHRRWTRLQLAIPVFVRAQTADGRETLEFATAINVSKGGALVVARQSLNGATGVSLEIPSAPIGAGEGIPESAQTIPAKAVWIKHLENHHLLGLKFEQPLTTDDARGDSASRSRQAARKSPSLV
jgi:hypothetical protein